MITVVYRLIVIAVAVLVVWELFAQKDAKYQANAALVLIPLLLRAFMLV
jgi:hypothetical protein